MFASIKVGFGLAIGLSLGFTVVSAFDKALGEITSKKKDE